MKEPAEPAELIFTFNDLRRNRKRNWHGTGTEPALDKVFQVPGGSAAVPQAVPLYSSDSKGEFRRFRYSAAFGHFGGRLAGARGRPQNATCLSQALRFDSAALRP